MKSLSARLAAAFVPFVLVPVLGGCRDLGVDNVLFVTRTDVAADFDANPATTTMGYKRDELVLAPVDPNGRVLPVLSTVGTKVGPLSFGANHSFATGDAAIVMARHLLDPGQLEGGEDCNFLDCTTLMGAVGHGLPGNAISDKGRKRYVFTTNESLGLEVSWTVNNFPEAVALGYKRKEIAFVPLSKKAPDGKAPSGADKNNAAGEMYLASLLATAQGGATVGGVSDTGMEIGQTIATGFAATLMATHPEVRRAMGPSVVPNYDAVRAEHEAVEQEQRVAVEAQKQELAKQKEAKDAIKGAFQAANDEGKKDIIAAATKLGMVEKDTTTANNFIARLSLALDSRDASRTLAFEQLRAASSP